MAVLLPVGAALLVYLNTLGAGFVHDDNLQIVGNPWVHELKYWPDLVTNPVWAFRTTAGTHYYRPVQMGLYGLLWAAGGGAAWPFHLANLLLHALTTGALAMLVLRLSRDATVATVCGLLFAVHPIHAEVVAWVASLPELTFSFFLLATLLLHIQARSAAAGKRGPWIAGALACAAATMLSKETGVITPLLIALIELLYPRGSGDAATTRGARLAPRMLAAARATAPYLVVVLLYVGLRWSVVGGVAVLRPSELTAVDALINAPALLGRYLGAMLWPAGLSVHHIYEPLRSPLAASVLLGFVAVVLVAALLPRLLRHRPDLVVAGALLLLPLLPALYLPGLGSALFAERYAYLPSAGFLWLVAGGLSALSGRLVRDDRTRAAAVLGLAMVVALSGAARTVVRNEDWRDDRRLAEATIRVEPSAEQMYVVLGNLHESEGRPEQALGSYEAGLAVLPDSLALRVARANLLLVLGRITPEQALVEFGDVETVDPRMYEVQAIVGDAYLQAGRYDEAEAAFGRALELNPRDPMLYNRLAVVYLQTGRRNEAERALEQALAIDPGFALARENLERLRGMAAPE
jgi:tetratricopeptide (TPR) repeat protein